jgi:imidazolonepropionase-like amidohydrolase
MTQTLIHNGTLIDGTGQEPVPDAAVLIAEGQIQAVGPLSEIDVPDDVTRVDAQGGFILPGLIDTHVHLVYEGFDLEKMLNTPFSLNFYKAMDRMRRTVEAGITTVRDASGADLGMKQAVAEGLIVGPRLQISVSGLSCTGGHGDDWTVSGGAPDPFPAYPGRPSGLCDGVESVRKKVREVLRAGADVVKVSTTGGVLSPTDHPEHTQFSPEELDVIVREAGYRGKTVMAHAQGTPGVRNAICAGIHSIEHGIYLDDEVIDLMVRRGTFLVPTLIAPVAVLEAAEAEPGAMPEYGVRKAKEVIDIHKASIAKAYRAGVRIALGTDSGVGPHGTNLRELGLLCEIGMSPMEALESATRVAAECLGWEDRLGTLEPEKWADVTVAACDPLAEIRGLEEQENITLVMQGGKVLVDRRAGA